MKTDKPRFIINKDDLLNSLKKDAYNEISAKCSNKFIKSLGPYTYNDVIKYIIDELSNETLISYCTFEKYQRAFYKTIETTINKKMFVDAEIRSTKKLLAYYYVGITDFENLQNNIFDLILFNTEKEKILQHYFKKFFIKNDVDTFVKIVFSYELIRYLFFLQADPLSEQPTDEQPKGKDYSDLQYIETAIKQAMGMAVLDEIAMDIQEPEQPKGKDYSDLYNKLIKKYFTDISETDFIEILEYKRLPNGKEKIHWIGNKADAFRFADHFKFSTKQLNDCFYHDAGRFNANNRDKIGKGSDLTDILQGIEKNPTAPKKQKH